MNWTLPGFKLQLSPPKAADRVRFLASHEQLHLKFRAGSLGFYDWPAQDHDRELHAMSELAAKLKTEFEGCLCIGIGGSHLGPETVVRALRSPSAEADFPLRWLSNVDEGAIAHARHFLHERRVATVVTSKSGGTVETLAGFFHLSSKIDPKGIVAITDPDAGELRRLATQQRWPSFAVPKNIGGRFSVLTPVGLFPAVLAGLDAAKLLSGAREMRECLQAAPPESNPAYWYAYCAEQWDAAGRSTQYLMCYSSFLQLFTDWFVQLWGESLGKKQRNTGNAVGFTPVAATGTSDQHSLLQLFKEGPNNKVVGFVAVAPSPGSDPIGKPVFETKGFDFLFPHSFDTITYLASQATQKSLANSGVATYRIELEKLDARALGALFFFFETACAFAGELYAVDAFDQPGVEESKKLLRQAL